MKSLKYIIFVLSVVFVFYNLFIASIPVLKGELHLTNDIGRDFLLLDELHQKKLVFIGPRTNIQGVYHGILWTYLNYPSYLLGQGDPVIVGWFWVLIGIIFLITSYFLFLKLYNRTTALIGSVLLSVLLIPITNSLFGQIMNFYLMPFFIYSIYKYFETKNNKYLSFHLLILGCFIQFNIGVGGLFLVLSSIITLFYIYKNKLWKHFLSFIILPLTQLNFILFDIKNNFNITKNLLKLGSKSDFILPINEWLMNRLDHLTSMQILTNIDLIPSIVIFIIILIASIVEIKRKNYKIILIVLLYYYLGYLLLSYFNKGIILIDHIILLAPLSVMWLLTLINGKFKYLFIALSLVLIYLNFDHVKADASIINKPLNSTSQDSWLSLKEVAKTIADNQQGKEFGYYIYSPDSFAYQQRYAINYYFKKNKINAFEYIKKPITYVVISAPPGDNPYMKHEWWIANKARINAKPILTKKFQSGYSFEKYNLSELEQKVPHEKDIELGIILR